MKIYSLLSIGLVVIAACNGEQSNDVSFNQTRGPTPGYYDAVDATTAAALRATLYEVIRDHDRIEYTVQDEVDVWDIVEQADRDPLRPGFVLDVYHNASFPRAGGGNAFYHREHVWPKSIGFPRNNQGNYPYTDAHHLMIADGDYNIARSNRHFDACNQACEQLPTEANNGAGGALGQSYPGDSNWLTGSGASGTWEVGSGRRGDIARAMFYMDVRYEGGTHRGTGRAEPDLILTDNLEEIVSDPGNRAVAHMGKLSVLLQWHKADPVNDDERFRNDVVEFYQGNRNPFIDHPEWVDCLFGDACDDTPPPKPAAPWINEIHYDNDGGDVDEGVEIAGPAGTDLSGFVLAAYNGADGTQAGVVNLSGVIPDQSGGGGAIFFAVGLQNGDNTQTVPDGVALLDSTGAVLQFLSYEGSFTAANGLATGLRSTDIGVVEPGDTAIGLTLQLSGAGCAAEDFVWNPPAAGTRNQINGNQTLDCR